MNFTSVFFLFVFFPVCIALFYLLAQIEKRCTLVARLRLKDIVLIVISLEFYMINADFNTMLYLCIYVLIVYAMGCLLEKRKEILPAVICIVLLLVVLYYCKYFRFVGGVVNSIVGSNWIAERSIVAPIGVSFVTFSALSYVIDIRRGDAQSGNFIDAMLYLTFFPKVVSGPIVLWKQFQEQMACRTLTVDKFAVGIERICLGFAKKLILADSFGAVVAKMTGSIDVPTAWLCALLYMLQIYYDFAGYSDIAIGLAEMFGFRFEENFDFPYVSLSITEFWRRWHISLGAFFREYLYFPLGGNRKGFPCTLRNIGIVFLVSGIWHGAGFGYLCWGMMHGTCQIIERCLKDKPVYQKTPKAIKYLFTMFVVMIGWEFFRLGSFTATYDFIKVMLGVTAFDWIPYTWQYFFTPKTITLMMIGIMGATVFSLRPLRDIWKKASQNRALYVGKIAVLFALMVISVLFMVNSNYSPFIYFQY